MKRRDYHQKSELPTTIFAAKWHKLVLRLLLSVGVVVVILLINTALYLPFGKTIPLTPETYKEYFSNSRWTAKNIQTENSTINLSYGDLVYFAFPGENTWENRIWCDFPVRYRFSYMQNNLVEFSTVSQSIVPLSGSCYPNKQEEYFEQSFFDHLKEQQALVSRQGNVLTITFADGATVQFAKDIFPFSIVRFIMKKPLETVSIIMAMTLHLLKIK